jgi:hypothetical protein
MPRPSRDTKCAALPLCRSGAVRAVPACRRAAPAAVQVRTPAAPCTLARRALHSAPPASSSLAGRRRPSSVPQSRRVRPGCRGAAGQGGVAGGRRLRRGCGLTHRPGAPDGLRWAPCAARTPAVAAVCAASRADAALRWERRHGPCVGAREQEAGESGGRAIVHAAARRAECASWLQQQTQAARRVLMRRRLPPLAAGPWGNAARTPHSAAGMPLPRARCHFVPESAA